MEQSVQCVGKMGFLGWGCGIKHRDMVSRIDRQCLLAKARQGTKKAKEPDCKVPTETDLGSDVCATPHSMP